MHELIKRGVLAAAILGLSPAALADSAETRGGIKIKSDDGRFEASLGGRIHYDIYSFDADASGNGASLASEAGGGSFFRRTRLTLGGKLYGWEYRFEEDFTGAGAAGYREMWIATDLGPGKLHIGQMKPPRAMEELTSSNEILFMERPYATGTGIFGGGRQFQTGLFYAGNTERLGYGFSVYNLVEQRSSAPATEGVGGSGRFHALPLNDGIRLHLGLSATLENFHNNLAGGPGNVRYTGRIGPQLALGTTAANREATTWQAELGFGAGPFTLQSEYAQQTLGQAPGTPDQDVVTYYAQASFFVTGESKPYDVKKGVFKSPKPARELGAVEVAVRYDVIRNDDLATRPEASYIVSGVNYHVNPNVRFMLDYWMGEARSTAGTDEPQALSLRAQVSF